MPTAFLALEHRGGGGAPKVQRYLDATPTQVGNDLPTSTKDSSVNTRSMYSQRVAQFKGSNDLYCAQDGSIHKYDVATGDWTLDEALPSYDGKDSYVFGPFVLLVNSVPALVVIYKGSSSATDLRVSVSTDGAAWTHNSGLTGPTWSADGQPCWGFKLIRDSVFFMTEDSSSLVQLVEVNPDLLTITLINMDTAIGAAAQRMYDHVFHAGKHYFLGTDVGTDTNIPKIHSLAAGSFSAELTLGTGSGTVALLGGDQQWALFSDGTDMYALANWADFGLGHVTRGWYCYRLTGAPSGLSQQDISTTVVPSALRAPGAALNDDPGFGVLVDADANPGGVPEITCFYRTAGSAGTAWNAYRWNGNATLMGSSGSPDDTGGDRVHAMPFSGVGHGKFFYTEDELDMSIESAVRTLGGMTISFRLYASAIKLEHGSVTSGPFLLGDTITGTNSSASGECVGVGSGFVLVKNVTSGPFEDAETITGTGGASATTSAGPSGGPQTVDVDLYYDTDGEVPALAATLANASAGSIVGKQIQGLTADYDGSTLYTVRWDSDTDGVSNGTRTSMLGRVAV